MMRSCAVVIAAFVLTLAGARAEEVNCPTRPEAAVVKVLYHFSIRNPKTFATCAYADGANRMIELRSGCSLSPVDVAYDARNGGMHECRETGTQSRCHIVCP